MKMDQFSCFEVRIAKVGLEVVRKGSRILNLTSPSGPGKPPAEGAVTFSTNLSGWVGSMLCSLLLGGYFQ